MLSRTSPSTSRQGRSDLASSKVPTRNPGRLGRRSRHRPRRRRPTRVLHHAHLYRLPATLVIERDIRAALDAAGFRDVAIETTLSPPWTTDWISESGKAQAQGLWHRAADPGRAARGRMPAMRIDRTPRRSAASARRRARRSGAAATASSRSTCSNVTERVVERRLSTRILGTGRREWAQCRSRDARTARRIRSASTCPRNCARPLSSGPAST